MARRVEYVTEEGLALDVGQHKGDGLRLDADTAFLLCEEGVGVAEVLSEVLRTNVWMSLLHQRVHKCRLQ